MNPVAARPRRPGGEPAMTCRKAFSLMEIILVVVIIGMLAALVIPRMIGATAKARIATAKSDVSSIRTALTMYESEAARFPTTAEGLKALIEKPASWPEHATWAPFLEKRSVPQDPWGNDYVYRCPGTLDPDGFDLLCTGPDGEEGTDDDIDPTE